MKRSIAIIAPMLIVLVMTFCFCSRDDVVSPQQGGGDIGIGGGGRPKLETSPNFSVMTYNVHECVTFDNPEYPEIAEYLCQKDVDIVTIQEAWCDDGLYEYMRDYKKCYVHNFDHNHQGTPSFWCVTMQRKDALNFFSHYLTYHYHHEPWQDCSGCCLPPTDFSFLCDCNAPKGFVHYRVIIPSMLQCKLHYINVITCHTDAGGDSGDVTARYKNFRQLANYIQEKCVGEPLIVTGDFNLHPNSGGDNNSISQFCQWAGLVDAATDDTPTNGDCRMDRILYREGGSTDDGGFSRLEVQSYEVDNGCDLSDHFPVIAYFKIARSLFAGFSCAVNNEVVEFTQESMSENCSIQSWQWDFGDGATSTEMNPVHRFKYSGCYVVKLTVTNNFGETDYCIELPVVTVSPFKVISPNGGEVWNVGDSRSITWSYVPTPQDTIQFGGGALVKLQLVQGATVLGTISESCTIDDGSFVWTVGSYSGGTAQAGANYKVRFTLDDPEFPWASDISDGFFTIAAPPSAPSITVTNPTAGVTWTIGDVYNIKWTTQNVPADNKMKIDLMQGAGAFRGTVKSSTENDGVAQWDVTHYLDGSAVVAGGNYYFMISTTVGTDDVIAYSPKFEIEGQTVPTSITVVAPDGGETFATGSAIPSIAWTTAGITGVVKIELRKSDDSGGYVIAESVAYNASPYAGYVIPTSVAAGQYFIRISQGSVKGQSGIFTIKAPYITVTAPAGGETVLAGNGMQVGWTAFGITGVVKVELVKSGGSEVYVLDADAPYNQSPNTEYSVPSGATSGTYFVRVSQGSVIGQSNTFTVKNQNITVSSPKTGEKYIVGNSMSIAWASNGITGYVKLELRKSDDSGGSVIAASVPYNGSPYAYVVPSTVATGQYFVRISQGTVIGQSGVFTIKRESITVTKPVATQTFYSGKTIPEIAWTTTGITGNVKIELMRSNGTLAATVSSGVAYNSSPFSNYVIPGTIATAKYYIKISQGGVEGQSAAFTIKKPAVTVTTPAGGEVYKRGYAMPSIAWTTVGVSQKVSITLRKSDGSATLVVADSVAYNSSPYTSYVIPVSATVGTYVVRVATVDGSLQDDSNSFTIGPIITVTAPVGGETFGIGFAIPAISWSTVGVSGNVSIKLRASDGSSVYSVMDSISYSQSPYNGYIIPETVPAGSYRVRIVKHESLYNVNADSPVFTIVQPSISVTSPAGGETFGIGSYIPSITWTAPGVPGDVNIQLLRADGRDELGNFVLATEIPAASGSYPNCLIPEIATHGVYVVRVHQGLLEGTSDVFTVIVPSITVTAPAGGQTFESGGTIPSVGWTSAGVAGNVAIKLKRIDSSPGASEYVLVAATPSAGSPYSACPIPSEVTAGQYAVSVSQNGIEGLSGVVTIVKPVITVTKPVAGAVFTWGMTIQIRWTTQGVSGDVHIEMVDSMGQVANVVIVDRVAYSGSPYNWVVPTTVKSGLYFIRVRKYDNPNVYGDSSVFTISTSGT